MLRPRVEKTYSNVLPESIDKLDSVDGGDSKV
jgi:hypothetical protein